MNSHRYLWFLIATIIVLSCSEHFQPETNSPQLMRRYPIITKSDLDAAVWDDRIQMNIFPYEDKYSLAIFQAAYDSLSKDSRNNGFIAGLKLKPTHRALIIRPKDEKQQRSIEQNQLLMVRYIPFGYEGYNSFAETAYNCPEEEVTSECDIDTGCTATVIIPTLYVYWPVNLVIPHSIDYDEVYKVFVPDYSNSCGNNLPASVLTSLENEVLHPSMNRTGFRMCNLSVFDDFLNEYVPLQGTRIEIHPAVTYTDTTDANGNFSIPADLTYGYVYAVLKSSNWIVTSNNPTSALCICLGAASSFNNSSAEVEMIQLPATAALAAQGAAYTFYNDLSLLSPWNPQGFDQIRIAIDNTITSDGRFECNLTPPFIKLRSGSDRRNLFFAALHELGHYAHYNRIGGATFNNLWETSRWFQLMVESFGSFASWHIGRDYYISNGYIPSYDFTGQGRQYWSYLSSNNYSPIFVDLVDDYNQYSLSTSYLYDPFYFLQGHSLVRDIIDECVTYQSVCNKINTYNAHTGGDYIDDYLDCYYYWLSNNLNNPR